MTGYGEAVPAGRDLTAQDVRNVMPTREWGAAEIVAERLNRIARPSGGVGQPDTADPDSDPMDGLWQTVRDYLDENDLGDELLVRLGTSGQFAAEPVSLYPDGACVQCGHLATSHRPESGQCMKCTGKRACFAPGIAEEAADRSPRSWSLPAPPPDDVTVVYIAGPMTGLPNYNLPAFAEAAESLTRAGFDARNPGHRGVVEGHTWQDYIRDGLRMLLDCDAVALLPGWDASRGASLEVTVARSLGMPVHPIVELVEGEPPAPEPQEPPRFERVEEGGS